MVVQDNGNSVVGTPCSDLCSSHGVRGTELNRNVVKSLGFCSISDHLEKHSFVKNGNLETVDSIVMWFDNRTVFAANAILFNSIKPVEHLALGFLGRIVMERIASVRHRASDIALWIAMPHTSVGALKKCKILDGAAIRRLSRHNTFETNLFNVLDK